MPHKPEHGAWHQGTYDELSAGIRKGRGSHTPPFVLFDARRLLDRSAEAPHDPRERSSDAEYAYWRDERDKGRVADCVLPVLTQLFVERL